MKYDSSKPGFRCVSGIVFQRQEDGSVLIAHENAPETPLAVVPATEWVEIPPAVSETGTNEELLEQSKKLHDGFYSVLGHMRMHQPAAAEEEHEQAAAIRNLQIEP